MIKIKVKENNNFIEEVSITGHAMFDDYGKDIVCAAVSSIVITTVNAIERLDRDAVSYTEEPFELKVLYDNEIVYELLDNMISLLKELEQSYPKNIRFV
jgi:hypothetical protein